MGFGTTFVGADALRGAGWTLHHVEPREADDGQAEAAHRLVLASVAPAGRGGAVEVAAVGLDHELHSGQQKSGVQMPIPMFTCGRGMPWAAHMRRKRNSRTERTAAGSTAPTRTRRSFAFPRRRGRAITSAAIAAGGMWRRT